jgi:L-alanine-DL-glutamate epimerase and related enzymes of enolase superfamily
MKIASCSVRKENLLLTRPYTIAFKTIDTVENGIIELVSDTGERGYGAFNPSYEVVGEKLDDALGALQPHQLDGLIGRDIAHIDQLCREVQQRFAHSTTARTGLEIALYDLYARSLHVPLVKVFGQQITAMPTSITIGIKNVQETLEEAREYVGRKFRILKIKLGISVEEDIERLVKLRETFGNQVSLIIDANQGYDKTSCTRFINETRHLDIQLIEQPLPAGKEQEMAELDEPIKRLIAADESLLTPQHAEQLAGPPAACGFFNIKLMKCGGITPAFNIASTAARHGIGLMWGCNDESIISITAALHTAFACAHTKFIDLDGSFDLAQDVVQGGFILKDGIMYASELPGLGVEAA